MYIKKVNILYNKNNIEKERYMNKYLQSLNEEVREYLKILSPEFPDWLLEYIYTPEMLRLRRNWNVLWYIIY